MKISPQNKILIKTLSNKADKILYSLFFVIISNKSVITGIY
jgi:hypothetical protein